MKKLLFLTIFSLISLQAYNGSDASILPLPTEQWGSQHQPYSQPSRADYIEYQQKRMRAFQENRRIEEEQREAIEEEKKEKTRRGLKKRIFGY